MHAAPQIGSILLGKYRVERVLGQGGMGLVVAARHEHLGELFAIKMMLPAALGYQDARERFMREARSAARMKGEHVARVHDVGTFENGAPYMVMEHLTGDDLECLLEKRGALHVGEAALYVYQACEAVAEAHALGIVHRDLKPANMFLTRRPNDTPCVKVIDFGISKDLDPNKVGPALTKTGTMVGTPVYMAPEQMANNKMIDARSDIWSLGIILYELVSGRLPFPAESMTELVTQVLTHIPVPPSRVRPGIPLEFDALVMRCLEKPPDRRFQTVRDLMAALHPFVGASLSHTLAGPPPPARPSAPSAPPAHAGPTAHASPQARGVPLGPHGLPRLNVTDTSTIAQPLPFGANLPYVQTVATPVPNAPVPLAQAHSVPSPEPRQTNGAWGGTNPTSSGKRGKTGVMVGLAMGGIVGVGLAALIVTRLGASNDANAVKSAASSASVAPVVSAQPVASAPRVIEEVAPKPQETVDVAVSVAIPTAPVVTAPNVIEPKPIETKPPITKPPVSKVPDF